MCLASAPTTRASQRPTAYTLCGVMTAALLAIVPLCASAEICEYRSGNGVSRYDARGEEQKLGILVSCFDFALVPPKPSAKLCTYRGKDGSVYLGSPGEEKRLGTLLGCQELLPPPPPASSSLLPQCVFPADGGVPSARARECTRQYCARAEYRAKISAYSMNTQQSAADETEAQICIARSEQDMKGN